MEIIIKIIVSKYYELSQVVDYNIIFKSIYSSYHFDGIKFWYRVFHFFVALWSLLPQFGWIVILVGLCMKWRAVVNGCRT
mgnify:CR=1 FL=1